MPVPKRKLLRVRMKKTTFQVVRLDLAKLEIEIMSIIPSKDPLNKMLKSENQYLNQEMISIEIFLFLNLIFTGYY